MKLFPKKEFTIESDYTKQEAINKITDATMLKNGDFQMKVFNDGKHFRGEVFEDGFSVRPMGMMYGHRAYRPIITGTVAQTEDKTVVSGTMEMPKLVIIMFSIMIAVFIIFGVINEDMLLFFVPAVVVISLINYGVIWLSFGTYYKWSLKMLRLTVGAGYDDDLDSLNRSEK